MEFRHPVFVVGAPRTGTTLAKEILNRHPEIHLFDEVHFFERIWDERDKIGDLGSPHSQADAIRRIRDIVRDYGSDQPVNDVLTVEEYRRRLIAAGRRYRNLLRILLQAGAERMGASIWGDSSPQDILYLDKILDWYPDARIVVLVRDPRAFLNSCKNYFRRGEAGYRERYNPLPQSMLWRSYMTALLEAETRPWAGQVMRLSYEGLVDAPEETVRRLAEHVGVEFDPVMLDVGTTNSSFAAEGQESRGIVSSSRERWREGLTSTEVWVGEKVFGELRGKLGYAAPGADGSPAPKPSLPELLRIAAVLPSRLWSMVFHSHKPFTLAKFRRVLGLFRG